MASNPATLNGNRYKKAVISILLLASSGITRAAHAAHTDDELEFKHATPKPQQQEPVTRLPPPSEAELKAYCDSAKVEFCDFFEKGEPQPVEHPFQLAYYRYNLNPKDSVPFTIEEIHQKDLQSSVAHTNGTSTQLSAGFTFSSGFNLGGSVSFEHSTTVQNAISELNGLEKNTGLQIGPGCWGIATANLKGANQVTGNYKATPNYEPPKDTKGEDWSPDSISKVDIHIEVPEVDEGSGWAPDLRSMTKKEIQTIKAKHVTPSDWMNDPVKAFDDGRNRLKPLLKTDPCVFDESKAPDPDAPPIQAPGTAGVAKTSASSVDDSDSSSVDDSDSSSADEPDSNSADESDSSAE